MPDRGAKTISSETTFETDIRDFATLEKMLWRLSEKVSIAARRAAISSGSTITLKLKTADFRQRTRSQSIHAPTQLAAKIFAISREMLAREIDGTAFRLMGAGVSALRPGSQADDTDMLDRRSAHAERAMDDLRKKFGNAAVIRGIAYDGPEKAEWRRRRSRHSGMVRRAGLARLRSPGSDVAHRARDTVVTCKAWRP